MNEQRTDREGGSLTTERLSRWFTAAGWLAAILALVFAAACIPNDASLYQFDSIWVLVTTVFLALLIHGACSLVSALAREHEIVAPRATLLAVLACLLCAWLYGIASMTMFAQSWM